LHKLCGDLLVETVEKAQSNAETENLYQELVPKDIEEQNTLDNNERVPIPLPLGDLLKYDDKPKDKLPEMSPAILPQPFLQFDIFSTATQSQLPNIRTSSLLDTTPLSLPKIYTLDTKPILPNSTFGSPILGNINITENYAQQPEKMQIPVSIESQPKSRTISLPQSPSISTITTTTTTTTTSDNNKSTNSNPIISSPVFTAQPISTQLSSPQLNIIQPDILQTNIAQPNVQQPQLNAPQPSITPIAPPQPNAEFQKLLEDFLKDLKLEKFYQKLKDEDIETVEDLANLSDELLKELGFTVGARGKIYKTLGKSK